MSARRLSRFPQVLAAVLFAWMLALAGCSAKPDFRNLDITGNEQFGRDFALPDTDGHMRTLADYKGRAVVLFFGYTHCPDVCPTTMAQLAQAMQQLGDDARRVQVLFVTVDPERDTAPVLAEYVHAFNPAFVGLRPDSAAQLDAVTQAFKIYHAKNTAGASDASAYTVDHTAGSVVFDPQGKLRLYAKDGQGADVWVHDLKLLIDGK